MNCIPLGKLVSSNIIEISKNLIATLRSLLAGVNNIDNNRENIRYLVCSDLFLLKELFNPSSLFMMLFLQNCRAWQRAKVMEVSLSKASRAFPDCSSMATKLRAMTYNTEEQVRAHKNEAEHLIQLAARTTPKGLHCLAMRLTSEYFTLPADERKLANQEKARDGDLYHYAVFSDNILACAVVVNSTVTHAAVIASEFFLSWWFDFLFPALILYI